MEKSNNLFTAHPHSIGESYNEHFQFASQAGFKLFLAGLACMIHSVFPFLFITTASDAMHEITAEISKRKNKPDPTSAPKSETHSS